MNNVVVAVFSGTTSTRTRRLWKIDKGMLLQLVGLNLPAAYQVHFSNNPDSGQATVVVATSDMVEIPYKYLQTGDDIYAWVYLTPENGIGYTIYMVTIPVRVRPDILIEDPSEEQQNVVDSAIAALNSAVEQTAADVSAANEYAANAEAAQIGAEAAKTAAEAAQAESEINATSAAQNATAAGQHASNANHYADTAEFYAEQAAQSAQNAANKASVAEASADEALLSARAASEAYNAANEAKDISIQASNAAKDYLRDANAAATNSEIYAGAASDKADQAAQNAANASENAIIAQTAKNEAEAAQSAAEAARDAAISNAQATITNANAAGRNADAAAESAELAASYLDTAISALNSGVESVQAAVAGVQDSIDTALQEAKDSGVFDGADGYTPVKGVDYFDGEKGDTGATGETGNGIASAVLNADYTLTLTYTDGTTWTSGSIRGERGDKGETGSDGYSPAATVTQTETGATVTVTDKTGTTTAEISNGQDGTTFTPAVSAEGVISWTNDGGKTNPQPMNIKGPQGDDYILTATDKEEIAQQVAVSLSPTLNEKAPSIYCEASGAIASFTDGADDLPVDDLVVQIEPVQDLHGYDSPWPAGGGKNKWSEADPSYTGTKKYDFDAPIMLANHTYTISATLEIDNPEYMTAIIFYGNRSSTGYASNLYFSEGVTSKTFTPSIDIDKLSFYATSSGATTPGVSATWTHFQIEEGSTATAYAPYSNICPISGFDGLTVTRAGKNLVPMTAVSRTNAGITYTVNNDGSVTIDGTATATSWLRGQTYVNERQFLKAGTYHLSGSPSNHNCTVYIVGYYTDGEGLLNATVPGGVYDNGNGLTFTLRKDATVTYQIQVNNGTAVSNLTVYPQIELGDTATSYEPYQGETYSIAFPSEAGTVYGGSLDVTTGVLTVDRSQIASYAGETLPSTWISDRDVYSAGATPTTGAQVVYELATPQTYQLTPTEIRTLLGQNNIWADTGDTTVTYCADTKLYIQQLTKPTEDDLVANSAITSGKFFVIGNRLFIATASIANGATITPGTNATELSLADALNSLNS